MQRAVGAAVARFGRIDGVVHAAGIAGGGLIPLKTREAAERVLRPKVHGTYVLADVLRHQKLDFLVLCSSLQALVGGLGQVDYCAASAVLDAYAQAQWAAGNRSVRVDRLGCVAAGRHGREHASAGRHAAANGKKACSARFCRRKARRYSAACWERTCRRLPCTHSRSTQLWRLRGDAGGRRILWP